MWLCCWLEDAVKSAPYGALGSEKMSLNKQFYRHIKVSS